MKITPEAIWKMDYKSKDEERFNEDGIQTIDKDDLEMGTNLNTIYIYDAL